MNHFIPPTGPDLDWLYSPMHVYPPHVPPPVAERIGEVHLLGPPGCGKTHALTTTWLPRAIERYGADAVAVVSLTKVAALEIASRQTVPLDPSRVKTLHAMCYAIVRDTMDITIVKTDAAADVKAWNAHVKATGLRHKFLLKTLSLGGHKRRAEDMFGEIELVRSQMGSMARLRADAQELYRAWTSWKEQNGVLDFTDLVEMVFHENLSLPMLNGSNVAALIVDEAQDLSRLDFALIRQWGHDLHALILAGDADQAIFEFRGATPNLFHNPKTWEGKTFELTQSYRVPKVIADYAEHYHDELSPDRVGVKYTPRVSERPGAVVRCSVALSDEHRFIRIVRDEITTIDSYALEGAHRDVMILAAEGFVLKDAILALNGAGIRYHNPYKPANNTWNPEGKSTRALRAFGQARYGNGWTWADLRAWACECGAVGFLIRGQLKRLQDISDPDELKMFVDHDGLAEVFLAPEVVIGDVLPLFLDVDTHEAAIMWLEMHMMSKAKSPDAQIRVKRAIDVARSGGFEGLNERPPIVIGTIHSVKGATAGSVILSSNISRRRKARGGEVARMFYVAMTRASERLLLMSPSDFGRGAKAVSWPSPNRGSV